MMINSDEDTMSTSNDLYHHLKASTVSQVVVWPPHEFMQPSELSNQLRALVLITWITGTYYKVEVADTYLVGTRDDMCFLV